VYEVIGTNSSGHRVASKGIDVDQVFRECRKSATKIARGRTEVATAPRGRLRRPSPVLHRDRVAHPLHGGEMGRVSRHEGQPGADDSVLGLRARSREHLTDQARLPTKVFIHTSMVGVDPFSAKV